MSNSTSNSVSFPLNSDDKRPLPEIIASGKTDDAHGLGWSPFPLAYHDVEGKRYYAVQDWILGVAQTSNPRDFWLKMKNRLKKAGIELSTWCLQLPYRARNGKRYAMDHADAETLYLITQRMDAETGIRDRVLRFLAKSGVKLDEYRIDPDSALDDLSIDPDKALDAVIRAYRRQGKPDKWIAIRLQSSVQRNKFTAAFQQALRTKPQQIQFAIITDELRLGLWKRSTAALRVEMGLKETANLRDHQSGLALTYEMLAEQISERELQQKNNLEFEQAKRLVRTNATSVGKHAQETGLRLGIDIATDRPLLRD